MNIDERIKEEKDLLQFHLDHLEEDLAIGDTQILYIISSINNRLNLLFREKEGYGDFSGEKVAMNEKKSG